MPEAGGAQREFPTVDHGRIPGDRPEEIRFADIIVIQPVRGLGPKIIGVQSPAAIGNHEAKLVFFIPLAVQRSEGEILAVGQTEERAGGGHERRGLVVVTVEAAKNPIQARNFHRKTDPGVRNVFRDGAVEFRLADAGDEGQPRSRL